MRSKLRSTIDDILTNGISNSFKVPDVIENFKTRTLNTTIGSATYSLHQAKKSVGVSPANITSINSAFDNSRGVDIGRVIGSAWDSINDKISSNEAYFQLNTTKGISQMAVNLEYSDFKFDEFFGIWNGKFNDKMETVVASIEVCPASIFTTAIGHINDLTTSCNGDWAGLGYISLDDAVSILVPLLQAEVNSIASNTTSVNGNPSTTGTTVNNVLLGSVVASVAMLTQISLEASNIVNLESIASAMAAAVSIQAVGNNPKDPLFNIYNNSLDNDAKVLYNYAPNLIHTNSIMAPRPYETEADTFFRVKQESELPTPSYNTADVLYKAAAFDPSIKTKYLNQSFDPRSAEDILRVFDAIAKDFAINPCGGDRTMRLKLLREHLDTLELNLLRDRIRDVRQMLND
jgi:hypothetical protein